MKFQAEMTDTFGGDANYSWVTRKTFEAPDTASDAMPVRRAKKMLGVSCRHRKQSYGDEIRLDLVGACVVIFISVHYEEVEP